MFDFEEEELRDRAEAPSRSDQGSALFAMEDGGEGLVDQEAQQSD